VVDSFVSQLLPRQFSRHAWRTTVALIQQRSAVACRVLRY
jgi:hypothetical protein